MFEDEVYRVTGASSGIGLATARALHNRGARLVLSALTLGELEAVADDMPGSQLLPFDVAELDALPSSVDSAVAAFGRLDGVFQIAGVTQRSLARDTAISVYRRILDIDLVAPIALTQLLLPHFLSQRSGRIVALASVAGKFGSPLRTAYCAAKHGVFGYFDSLRTEIAHLGIHVHVVAPGAVRTNLARNALTGDGDTFNRTDQFIEEGYDPEELVARILSAIEKGKPEIVIARGTEGAGYWLQRFFPSLLRRRLLGMAPDAIQAFERENSIERSDG